MTDTYTEAQRKAIEHKDGPMMVIAGPGSGKTMVITHRTRQLIENYGINPGNILVITFTKAASVEMRDRFIKLMGSGNANVSFGTFHSVFFRILKFAYNYSASNIIPEDIKFQYMKEIIHRTELEIDDENEFCAGILSEISMVKGDMLNIEHYYSKNCPDDVFRFLYKEYEKKLRIADKIDFDDMLIMCYDLLTARNDILKAWQNKYRYILVDEFQDINRIQYEIVKMLAKPDNNLFIVGDDDQSIYRFRGARPEIMLNFPEDYKDVATVQLDKNFRSGKRIVSASKKLIKNNKKRFAKKIDAFNDFDGDIEYLEFNDQNDENEYVSREIRKYIDDGVNYSDIAVLFRTNMGPRLLVNKLLEYNIPFRIKDHMQNIYEHWIAKDFMTYINLACGSRDRNSLYKIMNRPKRYIARDSVRTAVFSFDELYTYYRDKDWMTDRIAKLEYDLKMISSMTPYAAISYIRNVVGYDEYLNEYALYRKMKPEELYEVADELMEASKPYKSFDEWNIHIEEYADELKKQSEQMMSENNLVELSTMHSSKGLEYRIVFVIDANEGVTPHSKSVLEEDMEEERRMFYVAVTRAKERLHVYSVKERFGKPVSVSRFVGEMLFDTDEFVVGTEIVHKKYGNGTIKRVSNGKATIYFGRLKKELVFDVKFAVSNKIITLKEPS